MKLIEFAAGSTAVEGKVVTLPISEYLFVISIASSLFFFSFFHFVDFASKLIVSMQYGARCEVLWWRHAMALAMCISFDWQ
jgi:hypothetical protein